MVMLISVFKKPLNSVIKFCSTRYSQAYALPTQGLINWPWDDIIHPAVGIKLSYIYKRHYCARDVTCCYRKGEPALFCPAELTSPSNIFSSGCQRSLPKVPTSRRRLSRLLWGRKGDDEHWTKLGTTVHILVFTQTCSPFIGLALNSVYGFCMGTMAELQFLLDIRPQALPLQVSLSRLMNASFRKSISAASYKGH